MIHPTLFLAQNATEHWIYLYQTIQRHIAIIDRYCTW